MELLVCLLPNRSIESEGRMAAQSVIGSHQPRRTSLVSPQQLS
jgi:hypothetical protein